MGENRHIGVFGTVLTIIIFILLILLTNVDTTETSYFNSLGAKFTLPFQSAFTTIKNKITGNDNYFLSMEELKKDNAKLSKENKKLLEQLIEYNVVKNENDMLKEKMNLTEKYSKYATIAADVINKDVSNYNSTILINVGSNDGVKKGMTVIADRGLVGYIVSTTEKSSKVQVIIDPASTVSASISTTSESVICKGTVENNQNLRVTYIPTNTDLIIGDNVETSGVGKIYKPGIHIGTIKEIITTENSVDRYAIVEAAVDFSKLKTVLIITNE